MFLSAFSRGLEQLKNEIDKKKREIEELQVRLKTMRTKEGIMDLNPEGPSSDSPSLEQALEDQKETVAALRVLRERSGAMTNEEFLAGWRSADHTTVPWEKLLAEIVETSAEESRLLESGVESNHPSLRTLRAKREVMETQIRELVSVLKNSLPAELQKAEERMRILEAIDTSGPPLTPSEKILAAYEETKSRYLVDKAIVAAAEKKLAEERMTHRLPQPPVVIWETAEAAAHPRSPHPGLILLLGAAIGGLAGIVLLLVLERQTPP